MKVGIATMDWSRTVSNANGPVPGGANYIRLQQWRKFSKHETVTGLLATHPTKGFGVVDAKGHYHYDCDVMVMQRIMHRQLAEDLSKDKNRTKPVLNDVDDWYWGLHKDNLAAQVLERFKDGDETVEYYKANVKLSDAVVTSTPFLFSKMAFDFGIDPTTVHMIQNCVNTDAYRVKPISTKKPVIGWVGSTLHRSGDLEVVADVFSDGEYRMHHSGHANGAPTMADKIGISSSRVTSSPMIDPYLYGQKAFTSFDIGIAPLNDIPFNHAKSWIKAIEYAAAGIPFISTDLSEYSRLQKTYGIGRLATTTEEWKAHLKELRNHDVRREESKRILEVVREHLDVRVMAKEWDDLLESYA